MFLSPSGCPKIAEAPLGALGSIMEALLLLYALGQVSVQLAVLLRARGPGDHHVGVERQPGLVEPTHAGGVHEHHKYGCPIIIRHESREGTDLPLLDQFEVR